MKTKNKLLILALLMMVMACDDNEQDEIGPTAKYTVETDAFIFYADKEKFNEAEVRRADNDYCNLPVKIQRIQREGDLLRVTVLRPIDCQIAYDVLWNGLILESFPVQIALFVKANSESCEDTGDYQNDELIIDLNEVFKDVPTVTIDEAVFTVKDACSLIDLTCTDNCDVGTSN